MQSTTLNKRSAQTSESNLPDERSGTNVGLACVRLLAVVQVVQWLWQVITEFDGEERKLFLKFFTGSDRAPIGGLGNLRCIIQVRPARRQWFRCRIESLISAGRLRREALFGFVCLC